MNGAWSREQKGVTLRAGPLGHVTNAKFENVKIKYTNSPFSMQMLSFIYLFRAYSISKELNITERVNRNLKCTYSSACVHREQKMYCKF